jgi:hypothetical protein
MGQKYSGIISPDLLKNRKIANFHPKQIDYMREKFVLMCDDDLTVGVGTFSELVRMDKVEARKVKFPLT